MHFDHDEALVSYISSNCRENRDEWVKVDPPPLRHLNIDHVDDSQYPLCV